MQQHEVSHIKKMLHAFAMVQFSSILLSNCSLMPHNMESKSKLIVWRHE